MHVQPAAPATTRPGAGPGSRLVLPVCLATGFTTLLDQAILTVAVPALRADLGAGGAEVQWLLAAYSLTFGLALVPAGRLGDVHGRVRLLAGGLVLFCGGAVLAALAPTPAVLVLARLLQGIGAGTANPQVIGLIQDHFTGTARARALGAYAAVASAAAVAAPLVGGIVLQLAGEAAGWRIVVVVNVPFGLLTIWLAWTRLRPAVLAASDPRGPDATAAPPVRPGRRGAHRWIAGRIDVVGIALLMVLTLCALLPVVGVGNSGPAVAGWVVAGVAVAGALAGWTRWVAGRGGTPIVLPALLRSRGFVLGTVVALCWFGSSLGSSTVITMFLQEALGLSPLLAGLCLLPSAVAMGVASTLAWRVPQRLRRPSVTVMLAVLVAVLVVTLVGVLRFEPGPLIATLVLSQLVAGAAGGLVTSPNQALSLDSAPPGVAGLAAGFFQVMQRISATVALAACTGAFVGAGAGLAGQREGLAAGLVITLVMTAVALVASAAAPSSRRAGPPA